MRDFVRIAGIVRGSPPGIMAQAPPGAPPLRKNIILNKEKG